MFEHLDEIKPALKKLVEVLRQEYAYASVLASDSDERNWSISRSGSSLSTNGLSRDGGFVVRVFDQTGCGEYSFNRISREEIPNILERIDGELMAARQMPEGVTAPSRPVPAEEERAFAASTEYEIHPEALGDERILSS